MTYKIRTGSAQPVVIVDPDTKEVLQGGAQPVVNYDENGNLIFTQKFGDVAGGDYSEFEDDGTLEFHGDARVWEDLQVNISNIKLPSSSQPEWRTYQFGLGGVAYPVLGFAVAEYVYFDVQTSHSMQLNTILDCHIHFVLPNTTNIGDKFDFTLDVIAAGINGTWAVPGGAALNAEHTVAAGDDTKHRILELGNIPAANTTPSTIYKCRLQRTAVPIGVEYGSEVYVLFVDCHYQKNTIGSREEYTK